MGLWDFGAPITWGPRVLGPRDLAVPRFWGPVVLGLRGFFGLRGFGLPGSWGPEILEPRALGVPRVRGPGILGPRGLGGRRGAARLKAGGDADILIAALDRRFLVSCGPGVRLKQFLARNKLTMVPRVPSNSFSPSKTTYGSEGQSFAQEARGKHSLCRVSSCIGCSLFSDFSGSENSKWQPAKSELSNSTFLSALPQVSVYLERKKELAPIS